MRRGIETEALCWGWRRRYQGLGTTWRLYSSYRKAYKMAMYGFGDASVAGFGATIERLTRCILLTLTHCLLPIPLNFVFAHQYDLECWCVGWSTGFVYRWDERWRNSCHSNVEGCSVQKQLCLRIFKGQSQHWQGCVWPKSQVLPR